MQASPEFDTSQYFDPFAEQGQGWDPIAVFDEIFDNYAHGAVEHDYTADQFVTDTEALMLDAQFTENFAAMSSIAARMHQLCGEDHALQAAMKTSRLFGDKEHTYADGHIHHDSEDEAPAQQRYGRNNKQPAKHPAKEQHATRKRLTFDQIIELLKAWRIMPKRP